MLTKTVAKAAALVLVALGAYGLAVNHASRAQGAVSSSVYVPITAVRVVDTRHDTTIGFDNLHPTNDCLAFFVAPRTVPAKLPANSDLCVPLHVVPNNATAVVLNVTLLDSDGPGFVQLVDAGDPTGATSNLNKNPGAVVANEVTVKYVNGAPQNASAGLMLVNQGAATNVIIDVEGYYVPAV